ncbi:MAG: DinB family protein [Acidobacteria bacterium]|nr:DinB family protein [Acidobacteriota bacterium]
MEPEERTGYLDVLQSTPDQLKAAVAGLPPRLLRWTPAPGKWSILEIVCHMRDMERDAYRARYRRVLEEENPRLMDIDGDALAQELDYRSMKLGEVLRDWRRLRKENLKLLRKVSDAQWRRAGQHSVAGWMTMEDFLKRQAVGNDRAHLSQIESIKVRWEIFSTLERGPRTLSTLLHGVSAEALRRRPEPAKWSALEIACHLRDAEQLFLERYAKMAHEEKPALRMMDNELLPTRRNYLGQDPASVAKEFGRLRQDTLVLLRALPHPSWQRTGLHPKRGEVTIETLVRIHAGHDGTHFDQIRSRLLG